VVNTLVIRGGTLIGEVESRRADVVIADGRITQIAETIETPPGARVIDASGCWVGPGLVDLHTHLREPGLEAAETIASGARAAAVGGYSAVVAMPNTEPAIDSVALVAYVLAQGAASPIDIAVAGAITQGRRGEKLAPLAEMAALGVRLFTDDGAGVASAEVMRRALAYAAPLGVRLAQHCEEPSMVDAGTMNEGALAGRLGLVGRPALAEELMVSRDIELVRATGAKMHFLHLSTGRSLALVLAARREGLDVTAEVAPHHFTLDESACAGYDPLFKVNPPLRALDDVLALREALRAGEFDAVATDHAPHAPETKDLAFDEAPAGMLGLEHAAALTLEAIGGADADAHLFFSLLSRRPAAIAQLRAGDERHGLGAHGASMLEGEDANVVVFDPRESWTVDRARLQSRATNTPYHGRTLTGRARATIARGRLVVENGELR
jgi:dihydroorotase